jgi:hypothetical protein
MLSFIPVDAPAWRRLAAGGPLGPVEAWAAVGADGDGDAREAAEHEALVAASLAGWERHGLRLVIVAETALAADADGRGTLATLERRQVTAFFADDPAEAAPPTAATPLMWYDASELGLPVEVLSAGGPVTL